MRTPVEHRKTAAARPQSPDEGAHNDLLTPQPIAIPWPIDFLLKLASVLSIEDGSKSQRPKNVSSTTRQSVLYLRCLSPGCRRKSHSREDGLRESGALESQLPARRSEKVNATAPQTLKSSPGNLTASGLRATSPDAETLDRHWWNVRVASAPTEQI